jgi:hypothetical protein
MMKIEWMLLRYKDNVQYQVVQQNDVDLLARLEKLKRDKSLDRSKVDLSKYNVSIRDEESEESVVHRRSERGTRTER